jgi:periplasmic protein TonB
MFEQSILATGPAARKTGAVFASFAAQMAGIGVLICVPLIYNEVLPQVKLAKPLAWRVSVPPPPEPIAQAAQNTAVSASLHTSSTPPPFQMPTRNLADPGLFPVAPLDFSDVPTLLAGDAPGTAPLLPGIGVIPTIQPPRPPVVVTVQKPPDRVVVVGGDVQAAKIIKKVLPVYPALARQIRVSGTVRLAGVIAKDGTVQKLQVVSGNPLLVKAAVDAVSQWIYRPTVLDGQPVEVIAPIEVIFTLQ